MYLHGFMAVILHGCFWLTGHARVARLGMFLALRILNRLALTLWSTSCTDAA